MKDLKKYGFNTQNKTFVIAEIGINHNGSIQLAKKLIDLAKNYGFDAVKFQKRNPDVSTPEYLKETIRSTPGGEITYLKYKTRLKYLLAYWSFQRLLSRLYTWEHSYTFHFDQAFDHHLYYYIEL